MKVSLFMSVSLAALFFFGFANCKKDEPVGSGSVTFEITDAPVDDANIQGVFLTVADVKVDGQSIDNFSEKQTIDLLAYQNGQVKGLGSGQLSAGVHSDISLLLDYDQDAAGNSPGCYVLTKDGVKHALKTGTTASGSLKVGSGNISVGENTSSTAVLDVDLRKAITYAAANATGKYRFVTETELLSAVRLTVKDNAASIKGNCLDGLGLAGSKIVVYAYKKGSFTAAELQAQGESGILFKNAVSSALCGANGDYSLSFLEPGDYELHFIGYSDSNNDGKLEVKGRLDISVLGELDFKALSLGAGVDLLLNVTVIGIIP